MFRLTRQVRFAINAVDDDQLSHRPSNSYGGYPSLTGAGQFFELDVTLEGELRPPGNYLLNIKDIDAGVREKVVPVFAHDLGTGSFGSGINTMRHAWQLLHQTWPRADLIGLRVALTPFLSITLKSSELPMVRLSQKFEFCASHRLHNPELSDEENRRFFGKCNNPRGHGHNYELQVCLRGNPDSNGQLISIPELEQIVSETVIEKFDHRNLNAELIEFRNVNPSVENIARVIYELLKPKFGQGPALASVTVWETPKTSCQYGE